MAYGLTQSADLERGSSHYFSRADNALLEAGGACTIEAWVNFESLIGGGAAAYVLVSKRGGATDKGYIFKILNDGSNNITLVLQASSNGSSFNGDTNVAWSAAPSNATWYHVAVTFNAGTVKYFVDGTQMGADQTSAISSIFDSAGDFNIGREAAGSDHFDGKLSLARFWQTVRTGAQLSANKCNVLGTTANLSGEWTLDNTVNDNSGNSLTLTNNNTTPFVSDVPSVCTTTASPPTLALMGVGT